jgi:hypothetical protein
MREVDLLLRLRNAGIPVRYHLLADVLFRADLWLNSLVVCLYFPNPNYRSGKDAGRKPPAESFFAGATPSFEIVHFPVERQGFGRVWLAKDDSLRALAQLIRRHIYRRRPSHQAHEQVHAPLLNDARVPGTCNQAADFGRRLASELNYRFGSKFLAKRQSAVRSTGELLQALEALNKLAHSGPSTVVQLACSQTGLPAWIQSRRGKSRSQHEPCPARARARRGRITP